MGTYEDKIPPNNFTTDGCSGYITRLCRKLLGRNPKFQECCYSHDELYYFGGNFLDRFIAGLILMKCVWKYNKLMSPIMFIGVRIFGCNCFTFTCNWNNGWYFTHKDKRLFKFKIKINNKNNTKDKNNVQNT